MTMSSRTRILINETFETLQGIINENLDAEFSKDDIAEWNNLLRDARSFNTLPLTLEFKFANLPQSVREGNRWDDRDYSSPETDGSIELRAVYFANYTLLGGKDGIGKPIPPAATNLRAYARHLDREIDRQNDAGLDFAPTIVDRDALSKKVKNMTDKDAAELMKLLEQMKATAASPTESTKVA